MLDLFWIAIFLFVFAIAIIVGSKLKDEMFPALETIFGPGEATDVMNVANSAFNSLDAIFLFITISLSIVMIVLAFQVESHPVFFFVNLILLLVLLAVTPMLSNFIRQMLLTSEFSAYSSKYTMMSAVFQYFPIFMGAIGFIISIAQFAKGGGDKV